MKNPFENFGQEPAQTEVKERKQRSDVLLRFLRAANGIVAFHEKKFEEVFSSEQSKRNFIEHLTAEEFVDLLNGLNGILRGKKQTDWGMDGETVRVSSQLLGVAHIPPMQEDKIQLFEEALEAAQELNRENKNLQDVALLVSSTLNAVHAYSDGNGRTSRLIYILLSKELTEETKQELEQTLSTEGRYKTRDIDPGTIQLELEELLEKEVGIKDRTKNPKNITNIFYENLPSEWRYDTKVKQETRHDFESMVQDDPRYAFWSVFATLDSSRIDKYVQTYGKRSAILLEKLTVKLTEEDLQRILGEYRKLKKEYVEKLIDCLTNPERSENQIEENGKKVSLKKLLETRVEKNFEAEVRKENEKQKLEMEERKKQLQRKNTERAVAELFSKGEGEVIEFSSAELKELRLIDEKIDRALAKEKSYATEHANDSEQEKLETIKKMLPRISRYINPDISISSEQFDLFVKNRRDALLQSFEKYHCALQLLEVLEQEKQFAYKITTSNDVELRYSDQKWLESRKDISSFLDQFLTQSVYFVTPMGSSLRLKLFNVNSSSSNETIRQPFMERIFYSQQIASSSESSLALVESEQPKLDDYVFEISGADFPRTRTTPVRTIKDTRGIYVEIPKNAVTHQGWVVSHIEKLA